MSPAVYQRKNDEVMRRQSDGKVRHRTGWQHSALLLLGYRLLGTPCRRCEEIGDFVLLRAEIDGGRLRRRRGYRPRGRGAQHPWPGSLSNPISWNRKGQIRKCREQLGSLNRRVQKVSINSTGSSSFLFVNCHPLWKKTCKKMENVKKVCTKLCKKACNKELRV